MWEILPYEEDLGFHTQKNSVDVLNGGYHENFKEYIENNLLDKITPNGRAIDGGASYGWFVPILYDFVDIIECFEIRTDVFNYLNRNMNKFGFDQVKTHNLGLSSYCGSAHHNIGLLRGKEHWTGSTQIVDSNHPGAFECSVVTLDSLNFDDVSFVKLDVEGHEVEALRGAKNTIQTCRPICVVEHNKRTHISKKQDILKYFSELNYNFFGARRLDMIFVPSEKI